MGINLRVAPCDRIFWVARSILQNQIVQTKPVHRSTGFTAAVGAGSHLGTGFPMLHYDAS